LLASSRERSHAAITELLHFRKLVGVILRDALPGSQRLYANGPFENCQVRMFVKQGNCQARMFLKQLNRRLQQLLAVEKNIYTKAKIFKSLHEMF